MLRRRQPSFRAVVERLTTCSFRNQAERMSETGTRAARRGTEKKKRVPPVREYLKPVFQLQRTRGTRELSATKAEECVTCWASADHFLQISIRAPLLCCSPSGRLHQLELPKAKPPTMLFRGVGFATLNHPYLHRRHPSAAC